MTVRFADSYVEKLFAERDFRGGACHCRRELSFCLLVFARTP